MAYEYIETVVIGAGQQGCGAAGALAEIGHDALVLERGEIGQAWAHERWDSLRIGNSASVALPGREYVVDDPPLSGPQLARYLGRYAVEMGLRVREHTGVRAVTSSPGSTEVRFRTHVEGGVVASRNLVAALGGYASPRVPALAADVDPAVTQRHSRDYRNPDALPPGAVLVVGAGISGQQIADELADAGRSVFLSLGRHRAWPRHYRGRPITEWMHAFDFYDDFCASSSGVDEDGHPRVGGLPVMFGNDGTRELNVGTLTEKGVVLVGSLRGARGRRLHLASNVAALAEDAARSYRHVQDVVDDGLRRRGFATPPPEPAPRVRTDQVREFGAELDLERHGVTSILWCTGFGPDYRVLPAPFLDAHGDPIRRHGVLGSVPGLYYAGLPEGGSVARAGIPAVVDTGRFIAKQVHIDSALRAGAPDARLSA